MDPSPSSPFDNNTGWPIALRKCIWSTCNPHPIYNVVSYHRLSSSYFAFISFVSSLTIPKNMYETLVHPGWQQAMIYEMHTIKHSGTYELVCLPQERRQLVVDGSKLLRLVLMVNLIVLSLV